MYIDGISTSRLRTGRMKRPLRNILEFIVFLTVVLAATFIKELSCSKGDNLPQSNISSQSNITQVYIDMVGTLHVSGSCKGIARFGNRRDADTLNVRSIRKVQLKKICSRCVKTEDLENLIIEADR